MKSVCPKENLRNNLRLNHQKQSNGRYVLVSIDYPQEDLRLACLSHLSYITAAIIAFCDPLRNVILPASVFAHRQASRCTISPDYEQ